MKTKTKKRGKTVWIKMFWILDGTVTVLSPVYSDTTQLSSTRRRRRVELSYVAINGALHAIIGLVRLVANCSTTEHQQWWRFGLQQLYTATGGHPADGSVMSNWWPQTSSGRHVRQTSEVCSQIRWCNAVQWAIYDSRQLVLNALGGFQPVEID